MKIDMYLSINYANGTFHDYRKNVFESLSDAYLFLNSKLAMRYTVIPTKDPSVTVYPAFCILSVDDSDAGDNLSITGQAWISLEAAGEVTEPDSWHPINTAHELAQRAGEIAENEKRVRSLYPNGIDSQESVVG